MRTTPALSNELPRAFVTGAAGGIGYAVCELLVKEGYRVWMHDLPDSPGHEKAAVLNTTYGDNSAFFIPGDLSDIPDLKTQAGRWLEAYGPFRVLVNNAGIDTMGPLETTSLDEFLRTQHVNAEAAYVLCQAFAPGMAALGGGQIVNNLSIILSGGWSDRVPYAMSKGALLGLTRALARELGPSNIRVNAVSPGAIPTALEHKFWKDNRAEIEQFILDRQALKFRATVDDVANAVFFLISPQSRFITGHELHVNGGWYMG